VEAHHDAGLNPDYLAYEPQELIGGNISVTKAKPDIISRAVELVKGTSPKIKVLCGAGVHSREDILKALQLGAKGVLIGHAVPKAKDPQKVLRELLK
ncbi:MAG: triose-phosphate isomerase, partial [Nanoarchaeota archaeon]